MGDLSELHEKSKQYTKFNIMKEILHNGDNLEFMKSLESESIDLIYSDILYGTGRKQRIRSQSNGFGNCKKKITSL